MKTLLTILLILAMAGVLGVLLTGVVGFARQGHDPRRSNELMRWRVLLQAAALVIVALLLLLVRS